MILYKLCPLCNSFTGWSEHLKSISFQNNHHNIEHISCDNLPITEKSCGNLPSQSTFCEVPGSLSVWLPNNLWMKKTGTLSFNSWKRAKSVGAVLGLYGAWSTIWIFLSCFVFITTEEWRNGAVTDQWGVVHFVWWHALNKFLEFEVYIAVLPIVIYQIYS